MKRFLLIILWVSASLSTLLMSSCDTILQYPDVDEPVPPAPEKTVTLKLSLDLALNILGEYEYDFEELNALAPTRSLSPMLQPQLPHHTRFVLRAFDPSDKSPHPEPVFEKIITSPETFIPEKYVSLDLGPGDYKLLVWADQVDIDSSSDKYYDTSDFSEIILKSDGGHCGSNDFRDALYGETFIHIPESIESELIVEMDLKRPMAKYTFISNDLEEFLDKERTGIRREETQTDFKAPQLVDYRVRMVYTRYMPCSFNAHTGKPADSRLGVEFISPISIPHDDKATLAFDYVFTNGAETSVSVAMEVVHKSGAVVSRVPSFDVPLKRSCHTIVTGKFLTTKSDGEIGVNPDFNGEFNIEIK